MTPRMPVAHLSLKLLLVGLAMVMAAGLAVAMKPTTRLAEQKPPVNLELMIPRAFADWKLDPSLAPIIASPDVQAKLDNIYDQTLSRTYVNGSGSRVMLSIAYGADQLGESMQVHRPEFCYSAQGFRVVTRGVGHIGTQMGQLPVKRLFASQGNRLEPITYWIVIDNRASLPGISRKLVQLEYGLSGRVPDGMLVRVSSIDEDEQRAFQIQDQFVKELLASLSDSDRMRVAGTITESP